MFHHADALIAVINFALLWLGLAAWGAAQQYPFSDVNRLQPWEERVEIQLAADQAQQEKKIETFDLNQQRTGTITVDPKTGRIDTFDRYGNRTGYGQVDSKTGHVDLYDRFGNRIGTGQIQK